MSNHDTMSFTDESVKSQSFNDRPEHFRVKKGRVDRVRILTAPVSYFGANVRFKHEDKGFFAISIANHDDMVAAYNGDTDALKRCKKQCPLWRSGFTMKRRFCALLYHVSSQDRRGKRRKVGNAYPFAFDEGKFEQIRTIVNNLPTKKGKRVSLRAAELLITCEDTGYQKMAFSMTSDKPESSLRDIADEVEEFFDGDKPLTGACSLIEDFIAPDTPLKLQSSLDRAAGKATDEDGDDGFDDYGDEDEDEKPKSSKKRGKKKAAGKKRRRPEPEDDDDDDDLGEELDSALDDDEDEGEDIDADDYDDEDDDDLED